MTELNLLPLSGIAVIVIGFALRFNPLLVVTSAGLVTGFAVGIDFVDLIATFGEKFMNSRQPCKLFTYLTRDCNFRALRFTATR